MKIIWLVKEISFFQECILKKFHDVSNLKLFIRKEMKQIYQNVNNYIYVIGMGLYLCDRYGWFLYYALYFYEQLNFNQSPPKVMMSLSSTGYYWFCTWSQKLRHPSWCHQESKAEGKSWHSDGGRAGGQKTCFPDDIAEPLNYPTLSTYWASSNVS